MNGSTTTKFTGGEREIEEKVPTRHTVYTSGGVLHTNNYLRGTWRTMLSNGFVNEAKIEKNGKPFRFITEKLVINK